MSDMAAASAAGPLRRQREQVDHSVPSARGAGVESRTGAVLTGLPRASWTVLHDVRRPGQERADVDHVLIGPPGVFVIDTESGVSNVGLADGPQRPDDDSRERTASAAVGAALAVARLVPHLDPADVHPVLCLTGHGQPAGNAGDVALATTSTLIDLVTRAPVRLDPETVRAVTRDLGGHLEAASATRVLRPGPRPGWAAERRRRTPSAGTRPGIGRTRPGRAPVAALAKAGAALIGLAVIATRPEIVQGAAQLVARAIS